MPCRGGTMTENMTDNEIVPSDLPETVISAVHRSRQRTVETAKKLAEAVSAAAARLPGREVAHRLPAPPFAGGLPKLPKLPETDAVRPAARDFAGAPLAAQRRLAGELVSAVSGARAAAEDAPVQDSPAQDSTAQDSTVQDAPGAE